MTIRTVDEAEATTPPPLRNQRAFTLFWSAETISNTGTAVGAVALPLVAVVFLDASPLAIGLLEAAVWTPWLLFGLIAGVVVDRSNQRLLMIGCDALAAAAFALVPLTALLHALTVPLLIGVAFVAGAVNVFSQATRQTYPPVIVHDDQLPAANSTLEASESVTDFVGAPLAGLLTHLLGTVAGVAVNAASFLVSAALLLAGPRVERPAQQTEAQARVPLARQVAVGLRLVMRDPWLRGSATAAAVANFSITGIGTLQALLLVRTVGLPPGWFGPLLMGEGLGGFLGALFVTRMAARFGSCRTLVLLSIAGPVLGATLVLTHLGWALAFFVLGSFFFTAAIVGGNVLYAIFRQRYIPTHLLGRTTSAIRVISYSAAPLGALAAGVLSSAVGVRIALLVLFAVTLVRGLMFLRPPWSNLRDLPEVPAAGSELLSSR